MWTLFVGATVLLWLSDNSDLLRSRLRLTINYTATDVKPDLAVNYVRTVGALTVLQSIFLFVVGIILILGLRQVHVHVDA